MGSPKWKDFLAQKRWYDPLADNMDQQLARHFLEGIETGQLEHGRELPPTEEIAGMAGVGKGTVGRAMAVLAWKGVVERRQGEGSFVRAHGADEGPPALPDQSLSPLSFLAEYVEARGLRAMSRNLPAGASAATSQEARALGLKAREPVVRIHRLHFAGSTPIAIEHSSVPKDVLPDTRRVKDSLYEALHARNSAPVRAIQHAATVEPDRQNAKLLNLPNDQAVLSIERTGYLASGRAVEWTVGLYRSDLHDVVTELDRS